MLSCLEKPEKDLEKLFASCQKISFRKKHVLAISCIILQKY